MEEIEDAEEWNIVLSIKREVCCIVGLIVGVVGGIVGSIKVVGGTVGSNKVEGGIVGSFSKTVVIKFGKVVITTSLSGASSISDVKILLSQLTNILIKFLLVLSLTKEDTDNSLQLLNCSTSIL